VASSRRRWQKSPSTTASAVRVRQIEKEALAKLRKSDLIELSSAA
jgi:DNA-directed RNA polymerase sigma subunit (sigma70/sigma32)